jgi:phage protein D
MRRVPRKTKSKTALSVNRKSDVRGVSWHKARSMWKVQYKYQETGKRVTDYYPGTDAGRERAEEAAEDRRRVYVAPTEKEIEAEAREMEKHRRLREEQRAQAAAREAEQKRIAARELELKEAIIQAGRRALALKEHPDHGGSNEKMRDVNVTVDRMLDSLRRGGRL